MLTFFVTLANIFSSKNHYFLSVFFFVCVNSKQVQACSSDELQLIYVLSIFQRRKESRVIHELKEGTTTKRSQFEGQHVKHHLLPPFIYPKKHSLNTVFQPNKIFPYFDISRLHSQPISSDLVLTSLQAMDVFGFLIGIPSH